MNHLDQTPTIAPDRPWLAPLAGFSDLPYRLLCRENGAAAACTEMISAKGLMYGSPGTDELLATAPGDGPLVLQLYASEPEFLEQAAGRLMERGFGWFDVNMGCSVPKVVKTGAGAALLKEPDKAAQLVRRLVAVAGSGRVGVKIRLGWTPATETWPELARRLEDAGCAWITLHPRYAMQKFNGQADWSKLAGLKELVRVPVVASGDLFTAEAGRDCLAATGVDGLMFARGALYDPCIFDRFRSLLTGGPPVQTDGGHIAALLRRHAELAVTHGNPAKALLKMRTVAPRYLRSLSGAKVLRARLTVCRCWEEFHDIASQAEGLAAGNAMSESAPVPVADGNGLV